jgi:hypothetical protein
VGLEHAFLGTLITGGPGADGSESAGSESAGSGQREAVTRLLQELVEGHSHRMAGLGLTA